jgi:hypothetical protein
MPNCRPALEVWVSDPVCEKSLQMKSVSFVSFATLLTAFHYPADAQVSTDVEHAPTLTNERHTEDWSYLADPATRMGRWTEPFKYIGLNEDGSIYLTTGMELRSSYEGYENVGWGMAGDDDYVWLRFMPYADLHAGNLRVFAQPILSSIAGADRPKRPVDTTGTDILQAFVETTVDVTDSVELRMSGGRKLISLGAGRFIDNRYGPNVPQAFDGVDATFTADLRQLTALYLRPVENRSGDFDDITSDQKAVWGLYATSWFTPDRSNGLDAYYLGLLDRNAVFDQGVGRELVHTFGSRFFGDTGAWFWNVEAAVQMGSFDGHHVFAWGAGGEAGYRVLNAALQPEIKLLAEIISGDDDPEDAELGTFNPLFPRGKYFGALSPIGPRNLIRIHPSITIRPFENLAVSLSTAAYWRESTNDGIYAIPGNIVRSGKNSAARFIGTQVELSVSWQATPELNLTASASAFEPGRFIRETGPAKTITMVGLSANYRF